MAESTNWKKPSEIMLKRKKRLNNQQLVSKLVNKQESITSSSPKPLSRSVKRRNPFGCLASKRPALSGSSTPDESELPSTPELFRVLDNDIAKKSPNVEDFQSQNKALERLFVSSVPSEEQPLSQSINEVIKDGNNGQSEQLKYLDYYPIDWSLRTKLRFISNKPFNWCCQMSSADECSGTVAFVQGAESTLEKECNSNSLGNAASKGAFKQLACYWMHPNLPWFKLFPRISADSKAGKPSAVLQDDAVQASLMADWCESLTSAFQHLRCGFCPYFYLCCHHLTVLFRAAGVAGHSDMHALISPTSRGFRNVLKEEGIEFTMPLNPHYKDSKDVDDGEEENQESQEDTLRNDQTSEAKEEEVDEDGLDDADDAASSWLKDLGLDAAKFRSLDPKKIRLQREGFKHIDQRLESVIIVQGSDVQALFNYLLNSTNLVSPTGWQAGIPPTIIAPTAFKGATLKSHQVKSGSVRQADGEQQAYSLELLGPILPNCLDGLLSLFSRTQESYTVSFSIHEPSTSLNALPLKSEEYDSSVCCEKAAMPVRHLRNITKNFDLKRFALREVNCKSNAFAWIL